MPFTSLRNRPASHKRHSTIDTTSTRPDTASGQDEDIRFERLSLGLTTSNGEIFQPFLTQEPEDIESRRESLQKQDAPASADNKSASTPAVLTALPPTEETLGLNITDLEDTLSSRPQRFSLLRFKNASDPQLSTRFRTPGLTSPSERTVAPTIITTAPTSHAMDETAERKSLSKIFGRPSSPFRRLSQRRPQLGTQSGSKDAVKESGNNFASMPELLPPRPSTDTRLPRTTQKKAGAPPAYGDDSSSQLAIPVDRLSDSSRSDGSSGSHQVYAQTTTTHTVSTTTTFFKLKRRTKDKGPLFPLPERLPRPSSGRTSISGTPRISTGRKSISPSRRSNTIRFDLDQHSPPHSATNSTLALTNAPLGFPGPSIVRKESTMSTHSGQSTPSLSLIPPSLSARGRSSTMGSLGKSVEKLVEALPTQTGSARTSTSTSGRRSFGDLLLLPHRLRQNSAPPGRHGAANSPLTPGSKPNSFQISRETEPELIYPRREDSDTPASYLEKLEAAVPRGVMATILCKTADEFAKTCLRKYMRGFSYFGESIDMSIRKMLMEVELPKETQQIDRLLAGFADRYYECNPGIFASIDEASFVAFSILLLHSDTHNKNNKRKMQKLDYVKNTQQGNIQVSADILDCFYDNTCYTPFIHFDDEIAINSHRLAAPKPRKSLIKAKGDETLKGPIDPYSLILDNKIDMLRPPLKDVMDTEDTYRSLTSEASFDVNELHTAFNKSSVLQIISARSRPDAFSTQATISNPAEAQAGLVSIKVAKVGFLWRKDAKKKKAKSPWREWGAILTDSKLYFFKDIGWVKKLVAQQDLHKPGTRTNTLIFKPPLQTFEPDALMVMDDAVALIDSSYKKHKHAFTFIKHGGFEEVFLANTDQDMYDWMGKLNFAAAFRTAGVRMRGTIGVNYEGQRLFRKDSEVSTKSTDNLTKDGTPANRKLDNEAVWEIMFYRRQLINEKISDYDEKIAGAQKELDNLLRNARHLLLQLPIQSKTRESLVLAAGRMSAKLKWTRVEVWRTRTHRDILVKDLEQEGSSSFPVPGGRHSIAATPQKITPLKTNETVLDRTNTDNSRLTLSPISVNSNSGRQPSQSILAKVNQSDVLDETPSKHALRPDSPSLGSHIFGLRLTSSDSQLLSHKASVVSSHSKVDHHLVMSAQDPEDQLLRDAGVMGIDGDIAKDKRPETSGSDLDRIGTIFPTTENTRTPGGSVRRSLQRTLRDPHSREGVVHHSPSHHRHKRGKESSSSLVISDDGIRSVSGESDELKRGTGSFILHGKKASVITMSPEWQNMSNEEKLKLREKKAEEAKETLSEEEEEAVKTESNQSNQINDAASRPASAISDGAHSFWKQSVVDSDGATKETVDVDTDAKESFVDAKSKFSPDLKS